MTTTLVHMTGGDKSMIAGCIDRMRADACGDCDHRDACAHLFANLFGMGPPAARRTARPAPRGEAGPRNVSRAPDGAGNLFLRLLGEFAGNVARDMGARQQAARTPKPASSQPRKNPAPATPGSLAREVENRLEPLLATGPIGIESVARALGLSRQTLYRRLKAEGATFEQVLDGLRRRLALRLIREEGLSVKEAAWRLGFSDPAAFSRAYKRWTGASPNARRRDG